MQVSPWQKQTGRPDAAQLSNPRSRTTILGTFSSAPSFPALLRCSVSILAHVGPLTCPARFTIHMRLLPKIPMRWHIAHIGSTYNVVMQRSQRLTWLFAQWKTTVSLPLIFSTSSGSFSSNSLLQKCMEPAMCPS